MISVIITTYNCGEYIEQAVKSILVQSFKDFELIIVDDGSTDDTELLVNTLVDHRIRFYRREHKGRAAALNYALKLAKYEIIALMDADDISHPIRFEIQLRHLKNKNEIIFTSTGFFKQRKILYIIQDEIDTQLNREKFYLHGHFNNSSSMFYKELIDKVGGYNENLNAFEDYNFWLKVSKSSNFIVTSDILHFMRLRDNSLSTTKTSRLKNKLYELQQVYFNDFDNFTSINDLVKKNILLGWREFFYGSKSLARNYWTCAKIINWDYRVILSFGLSYFPDNLLDFIKDNRIRLRLKYYFLTWTRKINIQKEFDKTIELLDELR